MSFICDVGKVHEFFIFHDFCVVTTLLVVERLEVTQFSVSPGWSANICDVECPRPPLLWWFSPKNSQILNFLRLMYNIGGGKTGGRAIKSECSLKLEHLWCCEALGHHYSGHFCLEIHIFLNFWHFGCCFTSARIVNEIVVWVGSLTLIFHLFSVPTSLKVFFHCYDFIVVTWAEGRGSG